MFKCIECQKEYKTKPDYCECGNDIFESFEEKAEIKEKPIKQPLSIEQKSQIISWAFFVVCIFFSVIVWLIPVKVQNEEIKVAEEKPAVKNIPNIDKFWDSTPPKIEKPVVTEEPAKKEVIPLNVIPYENKVGKLIQQTSQQKVVQQQPKKVEKVTKPQQPKKVEQKPAQSAQKPAAQQQKPKEQPKPQQVQQMQNTKPQTVQEQPKKQEVKPVEQPKKVYNPNSQAMLNYKGGLRAALFRKFPVGSIQGSGNCSVHFSVDSTGKLINRGFTKLSDNKSLNDAVYFMLMSVPKYSAPPEEYSGEIINMSIKINNGNYEIKIN